MQHGFVLAEGFVQGGGQDTFGGLIAQGAVRIWCQSYTQRREVLEQGEAGHMLPSSYSSALDDIGGASKSPLVCVCPSSDFSEKVVLRLISTELSTFLRISRAGCHFSRICHLSATPWPPLVTCRMPSACRSSKARRTAAVLYWAVWATLVVVKAS